MKLGRSYGVLMVMALQLMQFPSFCFGFQDSSTNTEGASSWLRRKRKNLIKVDAQNALSPVSTKQQKEQMDDLWGNIIAEPRPLRNKPDAGAYRLSQNADDMDMMLASQEAEFRSLFDIVMSGYSSMSMAFSFPEGSDIGDGSGAVVTLEPSTQPPATAMPAQSQAPAAVSVTKSPSYSSSPVVSSPNVAPVLATPTLDSSTSNPAISPPTPVAAPVTKSPTRVPVAPPSPSVSPGVTTPTLNSSTGKPASTNAPVAVGVVITDSPTSASEGSAPSGTNTGNEPSARPTTPEPTPALMDQVTAMPSVTPAPTVASSAGAPSIDGMVSAAPTVGIKTPAPVVATVPVPPTIAPTYFFGNQQPGVASDAPSVVAIEAPSFSPGTEAQVDQTNAPTSEVIVTAPPTVVETVELVKTLSPTVQTTVYISESPTVISNTPPSLSSSTTVTPTLEATSEGTTTLSPTTNIIPETMLPTTSNACESLKDRTDAIFFVLKDLTDPNLLDNPTTPYGEAFRWIWLNDPLQIPPCDSEGQTLRQRYALTVFYYATNGDGWSDKTGWLTGSHECTWYGVTCGKGDRGNVTKLELGDNRVDGSVPDELKALIKLKTLDLGGNNLVGTLPASLMESLAAVLVELDLEKNQLQGNPFAQMDYSGIAKGEVALRDLKISSNLFTGTIPGTVLTSMSNLEKFWIAENKFVGKIPTEIGSCSKLDSMFIYSNDLTGPIPTQIGLLQLTELQAFNNELTGDIPDELYNNNGFKLLRLDVNGLSGTISSLIGNLGGLTDLWLNNNTLAGPLPVTLAKLSNLENLLMNNNQLTGTIRDSFDTWANLEYVDLSLNSFTGTLPASIFDIRNIRFVYLSDNSFEGPIPPNYDDAAFLQDLYLDGNQLTGEVPEVAPGTLTNLTEFLLQGNKLTGTMPNSVCELRTSGVLDDLWADCRGVPPEIVCSMPGCCSACF